MLTTGDYTLLPFTLPNICKKKVTAAFDGVAKASLSCIQIHLTVLE
jgi:hypothetical protein